MYSTMILDVYAGKIVRKVLKNHIEQSSILETLDKALKSGICSGILIFRLD